MADKSAIEWTDATWNPIVGCSLVSPACTNCYAMAQAARIWRMQDGRAAKNGNPFDSTHYAGLTQPSKAGPVWTGKVAQAPDHILTQPLHWKKPRKIFVNSMGDLFHESVPDEWIARVFAVMALAPQHTFQILTKRSKRMREYFAARGGKALLIHWAEAFPPGALPITKHEVEARLDPTASSEYRALYSAPEPQWPLPNVWLGVTVEDQPRSNERRADLYAIAQQGWTTFVSYEPALGPIDWTDWDFLKQLIAGGESGPRARPSYPDWFRDARDFCAPREIAFFFKQWGEWTPGENCDALPRRAERTATYFADSWSFSRITPRASLEMHCDDEPDLYRVGKRRAGCQLDGIEHKEFPR